ncbi:hypothetical protein CSKR_103102 [Clonorchis sinensis]|uniref:Uncharacterized protein n=1 Tax=Clonorchis sinensis TaxID=79923 RepID=A0A419Q8A7_CLOSI|nr:hypothetical protein CSKR_103102 [Clonorchis sinensis]
MVDHILKHIQADGVGISRAPSSSANRTDSSPTFYNLFHTSSGAGHLSDSPTLNRARKTAPSSVNDGSTYATHDLTNTDSGAGRSSIEVSVCCNGAERSCKPVGLWLPAPPRTVYQKAQ